MKWASKYWINCLFREMGKSAAYFAKWAKYWPTSRNGQFHKLGVTYIFFVLAIQEALLCISMRFGNLMGFVIYGCHL